MGKHTALAAEEPDDSIKQAADRLAEAIEKLSQPIVGGCCHCHCHCQHVYPWYPTQPYVTWTTPQPYTVPPVTTIVSYT